MRTRTLAGTAIVCMLLVGAVSLWLAGTPGRTSASHKPGRPAATAAFDPAAVLRDWRAAEAKYSIQIDAPPTSVAEGIDTEFEAVDEPTLLRALYVLLPELNKYPNDFMQRVGVRRLVMCHNLKLGGHEVGGFPDFGGVVYLSVYVGYSDEGKSLHHELFHKIEASPHWRGRNDRWVALNPSGFHYDGSTGRDASPQSASNAWTDAYPGFVSSYSRSAAVEDRAELFGWLMFDPERVQTRSENDIILSRKIDDLLAGLDADLQRIIRDGMAKAR